MGVRTRCSVCNRFGQSELNNLCRACDIKKFEQEISMVSHGSRRVVDGVLNEFKAKSCEDISINDRKSFLNMIKRRMPGNRGSHITKESSRLENYGYSYPVERQEYSIVKGVTDIVEME